MRNARAVIPAILVFLAFLAPEPVLSGMACPTVQNPDSDCVQTCPEEDTEACSNGYIPVQFYSATLTLPALREMQFEPSGPLGIDLFKQAYAFYEAGNFHPFLKKAGDYRRGMGLSDWHFYSIVADYSDLCFPDASLNSRVLFRWFVLRKSGLDVQLFHTEKEIYLHAPTTDIEFGFFLIESEGKKYANLTAWREKLKLDGVSAHLTPFHPDNASLPLVMQLGRLPRLAEPDTIERVISFSHRGQSFEVKVFLNQDHLRMMDDYPFFSQSAYFNVGLSREAERSLLPRMEELLLGKTPMEKVEFLLSFTRTSFFYKDDRRRYGKEKPMTPEQTLYHSYSDCEDRTALFYYLNRQLVGLPLIVLDFQTHVGAAVELPGIEGSKFNYKGRQFVYCEPTGPQDILKIGEMWDDVKKQKARVLTEFLPQ